MIPTFPNMHTVRRRVKEVRVVPPFKVCSMCLKAWDDTNSFVTDPELMINGYQAFFDRPEDGLILFTHRHQGCHSTLAVKAGAFKSLYDGPLYDKLNRDASTCLHRCVDQNNLERCSAQCSMHWVREVLQLLRSRRTD